MSISPIKSHHDLNEQKNWIIVMMLTMIEDTKMAETAMHNAVMYLTVDNSNIRQNYGAVRIAHHISRTTGTSSV